VVVVVCRSAAPPVAVSFELLALLIPPADYDQSPFHVVSFAYQTYLFLTSTLPPHHPSTMRLPTHKRPSAPVSLLTAFPRRAKLFIYPQ